MAALPLAAVGALAVCSGALAIFGSDTRLLRLGVSGSVAAAVAIALLLRARERDQARELLAETSARRREETLLHGRLRDMDDTVTKLSSEIVALREELAEVTAAHSAAVLVNTARSRPLALTREAFLEAAAALGPGSERPVELVSVAPSDEVVRDLRPAPQLPMDLRPVELAPVWPVEPARTEATQTTQPAAEQPTAEPAVDQLVAEPRATAEPAADQLAAVQLAAVQPAAEPSATPEPTVVQPTAEQLTAEPGATAEPAAEQEGVSEVADHEDVKVIDLTAEDDTQPLRLAEVRKRA